MCATFCEVADDLRGAFRLVARCHTQIVRFAAMFAIVAPSIT